MIPWCRTKLDLFTAMPFAASDDALLVAEDVVNKRKRAVVKRYTAARSPAEYLELLGCLNGPTEKREPQPQTQPQTQAQPQTQPQTQQLPQQLHRYEIVPSMSTRVYAFFDVDAPIPLTLCGAACISPASYHAYVEKTVRADLASHFGVELTSRAIALSQSHTDRKASVHAVVRFETSMSDLALDVRALQEASPLGAAYDDIYNRFRCFRAPGSSKLAQVKKPVLVPCACSDQEASSHVVRPLGAAAEQQQQQQPKPSIESLPDSCGAAVVRFRGVPEALAFSRTSSERAHASSEQAYACGTDSLALKLAAIECGIARDIGVPHALAFSFDKITVAIEEARGGTTVTVVRGELSKRSFVCPGKNGIHASNRALLVYRRNLPSGARSVRFVCLDRQCRADNRDSVLERSLQ
jgi:hypothetical protein